MLSQQELIPYPVWQAFLPIQLSFSHNTRDDTHYEEIRFQSSTILFAATADRRGTDILAYLHARDECSKDL